LSGEIRGAEAADAAAVAALLGEFRDWWDKSEPTNAEMQASVERILEAGEGEYLLAVDDSGEAVGVAQVRYRWSVWTSAPDCWFEDLWVREDARRDGHGRRLVEAVIEAARERGCKRVELDVNADNEAALGLYTACGFRTEPKPPGKTLLIGRPV
jgi:ribosomal protein S18 acetylase RimI-like enzyme